MIRSSAIGLVGIAAVVWVGCADPGGGGFTGDPGDQSEAGASNGSSSSGGDAGAMASDAGRSIEGGGSSSGGSGSSSGHGSGSGSGNDSGAGSSSGGPAISCNGVSLHEGATGTLVSEFQSLLQADGYYWTEPVNGTFDSPTAAAVAGFQLSHGSLPVTGAIDPATCTALEGPGKAKPVFVYINPTATPNYDLTAIRRSGVSDVFFLDTGLSSSAWQGLKKQCNDAGLRLSAWIFMTSAASDVSRLASLGLNIHIDLENGNCSGSVQCVTSYVQSMRSACAGKLFTVATMPDAPGVDSGPYYGQDYGQLAQHVDAICPMLYKGNYNLTDAKLTSAAAYMENEAPGKIWVALQTYYSDSNVTTLPASDLLADANAVKPGVEGVGFFRYGLLDFGLIK